jgi:hypothetical protein
MPIWQNTSGSLKSAARTPLGGGESRQGFEQLKYAVEMERAGADALELNIYYIPVDPDVSGNQV